MSDKFVPEEEIKAKFYAEFDSEWLDSLDKKSTVNQNLLELLWVGFAHGYMNGRNNAND